ncbi:hypothetical protein ASPCAL11681 [Aspergillus calidoustus]|uniref:Uncharacterized protein n=1 Tax=Aspergillus calidoustus TaxID=454130 RepID=A0A0U5H3R8_ASPCI|nr:hypothetical protein ASPCAL11681 [Aspergillus calidoustus]
MSEEMVPLTGGGPATDYNAPFQVTIDAGAAASGMINFSVNALARISHAGIDHFAFGVSVLVGNTIPCTTAGLERFYTALSTAPVHAGFQKVLWFGFGHRTPIQILTGTESGCRFAALSACLAEVYSVNMAAGIMLEFTRKAIGHISDSQQNALPSRLQMTLLVEKCAGIFSASSFPLWAEQYMSFDREAVVGQHAWRHGSNRTRRTRGVASAAEIANALHAIMDIRAGSTRHLTLIGVADAALIAAIGAWLLELRVILYTSERQQDDDVWFRNFREEEDPHLTVIYSRQPTGSALVQRDRTIQISDMTALFKSHSELEPSHDHVVSGRVPWEEALERTFGDTTTVLLSTRKQSFASALGSAARIFSALNEGDPDVPRDWLRAGTMYFPASHGADFVHFAGRRFPELADSDLCRQALLSANAETYQEACAAFEESLSDLASWCRCKPCCQIQRDSQQSPEGQGRPVSQRCLVSLAVTIIRLIRGLSGIKVIEGLCPTRKGLEYIDKLQQIRVARVAGLLDAQDVSVVKIIVERGIWDLIWTEASPLRFAEYLFRASQFADEEEGPGVSASSRDGICFYLDILRNPLAEDPTALCWVNVIPGHIQFEGRLYNRVTEKTTDLYNEGALWKIPSDCVPSKVFRILERCAGGNVMLDVTDRTGSDRQPTLEVFIEVLRIAEREATVGPWIVVHNISRGLGRIRCRNEGCNESKTITGDISKVIEDRPVQTITVGKSKVSLFEDDPVSRLVVASNCWEPLIQREECLACSVSAGCKQVWKEFAVLCRLQSIRPRMIIG